MALEETPSFDDLNPVETSSDYDDDDVEEIKLEPGDSIVGELRSVEHDLGPHNNTLLHIARGLGDTVKMWGNTTIRRKLEAAELGEGDLIGIKKAEEVDTYEEDGEEKEFYPFEVRSL